MNAVGFVDFFDRHGLTLTGGGFFGAQAECDLVGALLLANLLAPNERCDTMSSVQWQQLCGKASDKLAELDPTASPFRHGLIDGVEGREPFIPDFYDEMYTALYNTGYGMARDVLMLFAARQPRLRHA